MLAWRGMAAILLLASSASALTFTDPEGDPAILGQPARHPWADAVDLRSFTTDDFAEASFRVAFQVRSLENASWPVQTPSQLPASIEYRWSARSDEGAFQVLFRHALDGGRGSASWSGFIDFDNGTGRGALRGSLQDMAEDPANGTVSGRVPVSDRLQFDPFHRSRIVALPDGVTASCTCPSITPTTDSIRFGATTVPVPYGTTGPTGETGRSSHPVPLPAWVMLLALGGLFLARRRTV